MPYKPLRQPGESIFYEALDVLENDLNPTMVGFALSVGLALYTWFTYFLGVPPLVNAVIATLLCLGMTLHALPKLRRAKATLAKLKQAKEGERIVAEYLDALRDEGCYVMHDLMGDKFNVDHVVIGPHGVFTVETKTISKPLKGSAKVLYDGERLTVGGFSPERDPIAQAQHQAAWLRRLLKGSTGKSFQVKPVVVYPGWYVAQTAKTLKSGVWVLEPKMLEGRVKREALSLSAEEVHLVHHHLKLHMRAVAL